MAARATGVNLAEEEFLVIYSIFQTSNELVRNVSEIPVFTASVDSKKPI